MPTDALGWTLVFFGFTLVVYIVGAAVLWWITR